MPSAILKYAIFGATAASLCIAAAVPIALWGSARAPEFYGAFAAAIVAAIAVILGFYYQDELSRRRDDRLRAQELAAEAIDLCFWLDHAANEVDFIESIIGHSRDALVTDSKVKLELPLAQFREAVSAKFFDELLDRAKSATRLPPHISGTVVPIIYQTFSTADRVLMLRGASPSYQPTVADLDKLLLVLRRRSTKLRAASDAIEAYLNGVVGLPKFANDDMS